MYILLQIINQSEKLNNQILLYRGVDHDEEKCYDKL